MKYAKNITELIGKTPLVRLNEISNNHGVLALGKCEFMNPNSSVKDRIGLEMLQDALEKGLINEQTLIIEPTSGNTGIALASICASLGLKITLTMPSSMSIERQKLLKALGANLILTPPELGMKGAVEKAVSLSSEIKNSFILQQFENFANPQAHIKTTAKEILADTDGKIDILVAAVGTGGTITGISHVLKQHNPRIEIIAVEPSASPVLSGGKPAPHKIQGIGAGFVPKILDTKAYNEVIQISNEDAFAFSRNLSRKEGMLVGISAGANLCATNIVASRAQNKSKTIVTILCDSGERYLSTPLYDEPL